MARKPRNWTSALSLTLTAAMLLAATPSSARLPVEVRERAETTLSSAVRSGDFDARAAAVEGLGRATKKMALPLVKEALTDQQWQVRRGAIRALLALKDRSWEGAVIAAVRSERLDPRREVLPILEPLGTKVSVSVLVKALDSKALPRPDRWADALAADSGELMVAIWPAALRFKTVSTRQAFERKLATLPLPAALPIYEKVLPKADADLQKKVLDRLVRDPELDAGQVAGALLKSKDEAVAYRAAVALGLRGDKRARTPLLAAVGGKDEARRLQALRALEPLADKAMFDAMKPIVEDEDSSAELLRGAYAIYGAAGHPKLARHLEMKLMEPDLARRAAAARVIGRIKGREALEQLHGLLSDGSVEIRREAARSLGDVAMPESIPAVQTALFNETDIDARTALIQTLGKIRTPEVVPVLQQYIYDSDDTIRLATAEALAEVRHQSAVPLLELLLQDRSPEIRRLALLALLEQGPSRHAEAFRRALSWLEPQSLLELGKVHGPVMVPQLQAALAQERPELRSAALEVVASLPKAKRVEVYEALLTGARRPEMRVAGLQGLIDSGAPGLVERLTGLTAQGEVQDLRVAAVRQLGAQRAGVSQDLLMNLTNDTDERVRVAAAAALLRL